MPDAPRVAAATARKRHATSPPPRIAVSGPVMRGGSGGAEAEETMGAEGAEHRVCGVVAEIDRLLSNEIDERVDGRGFSLCHRG